VTAGALGAAGRRVRAGRLHLSGIAAVVGQIVGGLLDIADIAGTRRPPATAAWTLPGRR